MGIAANEYLEFGSDGTIKYFKTGEYDYFGFDNPIGRLSKGIMFSDGKIAIQKWRNGEQNVADTSSIFIFPSGVLSVG